MEKIFDEDGGLAVPRMTVMAPTVVNVDGPSLENVATIQNDVRLCKDDDMEHFKDCPDYNTAFCRRECDLGIHEPNTAPEE